MELEQPTPGMLMLRPSGRTSACSWAAMTYGSTTAYMFCSSISTMAPMRRMSSCSVASESLTGPDQWYQPVPCGFTLRPYLLASRTTAWTSSVEPGRTTAAGRGM